MPRIRSIHPGLFTDEAFMEASLEAKVLYMGILTQADDNGVFEWKALTLKARILPANNIDAVAILEELQRLNFIKSFNQGGKAFGAIRNFRKYQRPQKPKSLYPLPSSLNGYVGLVEEEKDEDEYDTDIEPLQDTGSVSVQESFQIDREPLPYWYNTSMVVSPQMEDGGDISLLPPVVENIPEISQNDSQANDLVVVAEQNQAIEAWNQVAERQNLPKVQRLTGQRKTKLRRRLAECGGIAGWHEALGKLEKIPWLLGENDRGWKADFDFLCQEKSFTKLMEGSYDRDEKARNSANFRPANEPVSILATMATLAADPETNGGF